MKRIYNGSKRMLYKALKQQQIKTADATLYWFIDARCGYLCGLLNPILERL